MFRSATAFLLAFTATASADALQQQYEAASVMLETEIFRAGGQSRDVAAQYATWDAQRRADSLCALAELERLRGRPAAERYVREYAAAAEKARSAATPGDIMGYVGSAHARAKLDLHSIIIPITEKCGIGL